MNSTVKIVQPSGILDGIRGNQLRRNVEDIVADGAEIVLVDLQNVTFMDSSGLGTLVSIQKIVKMAGGKFFLCSCNDQVKMMFDLTKMSRVFKIFTDKDEFEREVINVS